MSDKKGLSAEEHYERLSQAVGDLYYAANWTPDRACPALELLTQVRDAAGLEPG